MTGRLRLRSWAMNDTNIGVGSIGQRGGAAAGAPGGAGCPPAGPALPCQTVTIACKEIETEDRPPLPGTKKKQADALVRNVGWLAQTFGPERIGFVTFTVGDLGKR